MSRDKTPLNQLLKSSSGYLGGPIALAAVPLVILAAYEFGGKSMMTATAVAVPIAIAILARMLPDTGAEAMTRDAQTGLAIRAALEQWAANNWYNIRRTPEDFAVVTITIDDLAAVEQRFGRDMRNAILADAARRLGGMVREDDLIVRFGPTTFAIGLSELRAPEVDNLLLMARRFQGAFDEPFREGAQRTYCTISIGLLPLKLPKADTVAELADTLDDLVALAEQSGPGAVRLFSQETQLVDARPIDNTAELINALETGQIVPHFQPQVTTEAGHVTGFEALARWEHPERGMIPPSGFLPELERAGLSQRLAEVILKQALEALNSWEQAGAPVHTVSVNFSGEELRNSRLTDYVRWELDRNDLAPDRLVVEVLESVMSDTREDAISRTLTSLSQLGCRIDLDDFGTGYTSILNIRRFAVSRIKLDRCLVAHLDKDPEQRRMVAGLLALGERLGTQTLAEGVETPGERAMLAKLGCPLIQGFVVARPMPCDAALDWLKQRRIADPETIRISPPQTLDYSSESQEAAL